MCKQNDKLLLICKDNAFIMQHSYLRFMRQQFKPKQYIYMEKVARKLYMFEVLRSLTVQTVGSEEKLAP